MDKIRVGIIGYGLSGRVFHGAIIRCLHAYEVKCVVTKDPVKQEYARSDFKNVRICEDPNDVFDDPNIDMVVICTANTSHAQLAERAMLKGKHVVVEKPFTISSFEAKKLIEVERETQKKLSVYHNRRYDGDFLTVKNILRSGALGRLVEFESRFDRFRNTPKSNAWREEAIPGSGTLYDLGPHLIDQALQLFGEPNEVFGDIRKQRKGKVDDAFELVLYYDALKVSLKASNLVKEPMPRFVLQGTNGAFVKRSLDVQEEALRSGVIPSDLKDAWGVDPRSNWGVLNLLETREFIETEKGDYRCFYEAFYKAVSDDCEVPVTSTEAYRVIKVIETAIQSVHEKRRVAFESEY